MKNMLNVGGLVAFVLFGGSVTSPAAEVAAGVFLGGNLSTRGAWADEKDYSGIVRPIAGASVEISLGQRFRLATEPSFLGKGYEHSPGKFEQHCAYSSCWSTDYTEKLSYIEFPLLARFALRRSGTAPYLVAGGSLGVLMSATEVQRYGSGGSREVSEDSKSRNESTDISVLVGGGVRVPVRKAFLDIEAKYCREIAGDETERNHGVRLSLGVLFPIGARRQRAGD